MPVVERVELQGLTETLKALGDAAKDLDDDIKALFLEGAQLVARSVRAPRGPTGRLAGSVKVAKSKRGAVVKAGGARVPYAAPIHFGWPKRGIRPQPFLYNALDARRAEVVRLYEDGFQQLLGPIEGGG